MKRVTGIGGIFFKAEDAPALQGWYKRHLGIDVQPWGGAVFTWTDGEGKPAAGTTIWSIGSAQADQFAPSSAAFMVNYRVEDLCELVKVLREEGCNVLEKIDESEYGKFAWVIDPEGNKVELWQPPPANERDGLSAVNRWILSHTRLHGTGVTGAHDASDASGALR